MGEGEGRRRLSPCVKETLSPASLRRMEVETLERLMIGTWIVEDYRMRTW